MHVTQCVFGFLSLYAGLVHSFSWEIVIRKNDRLEFYDINGTLTHTEAIAPGYSYRILIWYSYLETTIYDPVHNRVLYADRHNIYSFKIASKTIETLVTITNSSITRMTYDPATELLFWNEKSKGLNSISLKTGYNNRVNEKQSILSETYIKTMTVDICGGFIHWISGNMNVRARFDGSERETITGGVSVLDSRIDIDQQTRKIYWHDDSFKSMKYADLNGNNTREAYQISRPRVNLESHQLTFSNNHIYWKICNNINCSIWKIPKNTPSDINVLIESNLFIDSHDYIWGIAAKYSIEDLTRGVQNCERLKNLLPNTTVTNVSSDVSLLCVHGTKVSEESRCECTQGYNGERCDVSE